MKVNEIFYSLQGEGWFTGTPAVFVRLSGCNMRCDFCDTDHEAGTEMSEVEIVEEVKKYPATHVVITGGEPTLQLTVMLIEKLHAARKFVQIETNGSRKLPMNIEDALDWITVSPKGGRLPEILRIDELKVVYDMDRVEETERLEEVMPLHAGARFLQPCDRSAEYNPKNLESCIAYILSHPQWRLSLQTHKLSDIR